MSIKERLKNDYFGKNKYFQYENVLKKAIKNKYSFITLKDFNPILSKQVILRHDIDTDINIAKKMFLIEKKLGIKSTYYFRWNTFNKNFIRKLIEYGNEVSYHFEEISKFAYKHNINNIDELNENISKIQEIFTYNLEKFRRKSNSECITVASHGDFVNRKIKVINNQLLTNSLRKNNNILREAYDNELLNNTKYCSDCSLEFVNNCDFMEANNYYLLVHPRTWSPNFFGRLFIDLDRIFKGIKYKIGCKFHKIFYILQQIKKLPKAELFFYGKRYLDTYKYFTKKHPKYKIIKNKTIGACLIKKPNSFEDFLIGKKKQNLRTSRNKCIKKGYIFKALDVNKYVDDILEINLSKDERQGSKMNSVYFDKDLIVENSLNKDCFGVFNSDGKLLSYCYLINAGNFLIISRLLGHSEYLNDGIMFFMISECIKLLIETNKWEKVEYFFYDTYFGALPGLKKFKEDLGFIPYKVKYKLIKNEVNK